MGGDSAAARDAAAFDGKAVIIFCCLNTVDI